MRAFLLVVVIGACGRELAASVDASDEGATDSATDAGSIDDMHIGDGGTTYNDLSVASFWSTFDTATLNWECVGFVGGTFDGRYVYLTPQFSGVVVRYDTMASFVATASWTTFDTSALSVPSSFAGATFDGRYVYYVPLYAGVVVRYDTTAPFGTAGSWSSFDTRSINSNVFGYQGATFDGRYIYLAPDYTSTEDGGATGVVRFDTTAGFQNAASWSVFDGTTAKGFAGAVFDGRAVYFFPNPAATGYDGLITRYDTTAAFDDLNSWSAFDTSSVNPNTAFFWGGAFDGRYVYAAPSGAASVVPRYDTTTSFDAGTSWSTFDMTPVLGTGETFFGTAFDGRFVYFVPFDNGPIGHLIIRYDTSATFTASAAWTTFDPTTLNAGAKGFNGAVFDGRYVYFVPYLSNGGNGAGDGLVVRFDAKTPSSMPPLPAWHGSFF